MAAEDSRFARLIDVANETSSERRRAMLREVTEVFAEGPMGNAGDKIAHLDEVLSSIVAEFSFEVRAELAAKIGPSQAPLRNTAERLALDDIEVARPILEHSTILSEEYLIAVVKQKTQAHLLAVTRRINLSENVSHALVERGDDHVVVSLLNNTTAKIAHTTFEAVTKMAQARPALHAPIVRRADVPVELLDDIYLEVEINLREEILARYDSVSPEELDRALMRSRSRLSRIHRRPELETAKARVRIEEFRRRGELQPQLLIGLLREGEQSRPCFIEAFAAIADVEPELVERTTRSADIDALALLCRASAFSRAIFVTLAIQLNGAERRMGRAEEFGEIYEKVPVSAAQRAVRFWKVRAASAQPSP